MHHVEATLEKDWVLKFVDFECPQKLHSLLACIILAVHYENVLDDLLAQAEQNDIAY